MSGCCWYKKPITWVVYVTFSWFILFIDEVIIGYQTWLNALDILNLERHLPITARQSFSMLDKFVDITVDQVAAGQKIIRVNAKDEMGKWYDFLWSELPRRLLILSIENTVQFRVAKLRIRPKILKIGKK